MDEQNIFHDGVKKLVSGIGALAQGTEKQIEKLMQGIEGNTEEIQKVRAESGGQNHGEGGGVVKEKHRSGRLSVGGPDQLRNGDNNDGEERKQQSADACLPLVFHDGVIPYHKKSFGCRGRKFLPANRTFHLI